jgi:hypothetical protein
MELLHRRCCGLDVHKETVVACLRLVSNGKVTTEVRTFQTTTADLLLMSEWLAANECTHVAMEATGVYWKPVWHILDDGEFVLVLANAAHVKNVPGRKTDINDAMWLAELLAHGLIRARLLERGSRNYRIKWPDRRDRIPQFGDYDTAGRARHRPARHQKNRARVTLDPRHHVRPAEPRRRRRSGDHEAGRGGNRATAAYLSGSLRSNRRHERLMPKGARAAQSPIPAVDRGLRFGVCADRPSTLQRGL